MIETNVYPNQQTSSNTDFGCALNKRGQLLALILRFCFAKRRQMESERDNENEVAIEDEQMRSRSFIHSFMHPYIGERWCSHPCVQE